MPQVDNTSVVITGIVSLESPRPIPNRRNYLLLDAGIYYSASMPPLIAALRYFNDGSAVFRDEGGLYFIVAKVIRFKEGLETPREDLSPADYDLMGDIIQLTPVNMDSVVPIDFRPMVTVSGAVVSVSREPPFFTIEGIQYVSACSQRNRLPMPIKVRIPENGRWRDPKSALPTARSVVSVIGRLAGIERGFDGVMTHTILEMDVIEYLGARSGSSSSANNSPSPLGNSSSKLRFAFGRGTTTSTPSEKVLGKRPARNAELEESPSPMSRRRLDNHDRDDDSIGSSSTTLA